MTEDAKESTYEPMFDLKPKHKQTKLDPLEAGGSDRKARRDPLETGGSGRADPLTASGSGVNPLEAGGFDPVKQSINEKQSKLQCMQEGTYVSHKKELEGHTSKKKKASKNITSATSDLSWATKKEVKKSTELALKNEYQAKLHQLHKEVLAAWDFESKEEREFLKKPNVAEPLSLSYALKAFKMTKERIFHMI